MRGQLFILNHGLLSRNFVLVVEGVELLVRRAMSFWRKQLGVTCSMTAYFFMYVQRGQDV